MSNEARKDPPAGRRYGSLNEQFLEIKKKLQKELNREPAEGEIIYEMYMSKNPKNKEKLQKLKTKEILVAILLEISSIILIQLLINTNSSQMLRFQKLRLVQLLKITRKIKENLNFHYLHQKMHFLVSLI